MKIPAFTSSMHARCPVAWDVHLTSKYFGAKTNLCFCLNYILPFSPGNFSFIGL